MHLHEACLSPVSVAWKMHQCKCQWHYVLDGSETEEKFAGTSRETTAWAAICSWFITACIHLSPLLWMVTWLLTNQPGASVFWKIKLSPNSTSDINFNEDKTATAQPRTNPDASAVQILTKLAQPPQTMCFEAQMMRKQNSEVWVNKLQMWTRSAVDKIKMSLFINNFSQHLNQVNKTSSPYFQTQLICPQNLSS